MAGVNEILGGQVQPGEDLLAAARRLTQGRQGARTPGPDLGGQINLTGLDILIGFTALFPYFENEKKLAMVSFVIYYPVRGVGKV